MNPPAGGAPSSDRGAGPERPRRGYGRALRVGLAVSAVVHLAVLIAYPELDDPEAGSRAPILVPSGAEPEQGMTVLRIVEIDAAEDAERPLDPEEILTVDEPVGAPDAPSVDVGPTAELVPPGPSVAERLQPYLADPRLWVELDPSFDELTLGQILELELAGRIEEWQDSLRSAVEAQRALTDWTYTDGEGKRWGFADGRVYLGDIALPLPFGFGTPVGKRDEVNRRAWEWQEIQRGALMGAVQESWKERAQAIRARRDAERARTRPDTSGVRR